MLVALMLPLGVFAAHAQDATEEPAAEIGITMSEYKFTLDGQPAGTPLQFQAGKLYTIHFKNSGKMHHEILMGSEPILIQDKYLHDYKNALLNGVEAELVGQMNGAEFTIVSTGTKEIELMPGQELAVTFTLPDDKVGDWEMACFSYVSEANNDNNPGPSHYDLGMKLPIKVVAAGG
jgi:uncharacterized cupredoxin-like copper-binding protein